MSTDRLNNECTPHWQRVRRMMQAFGQATPGLPELPPVCDRVARARMLLEEVLEYVEAAGLQVRVTTAAADGVVVPLTMHNVQIDPIVGPCSVSLVEMCDALVDVRVVATGGMVACGVRDAPLQLLVDDNNMRKAEHGRLCPNTGKFLKPDGHVPPDVAGEIARQLHEPIFEEGQA